MAENQTHLPKPDAELQPHGYIVAINFQPPINLSKGGYKFAADISEYFEARTISLEPHQWQLTQPLGGASGVMQLTIMPTAIQFEVTQPTHKLKWITDRMKMVLQVFADSLKPKVMMVSAAKVIGIRQIDGDAREFLVKHVTQLDPKRFSVLHRPIHVFGIRVSCPPYKKKVKKGKKTVEELVPYNLEIKAESWVEDRTKLWLEADAQWPGPVAWDSTKIEEAVEHLTFINDFLAKDVMEFLKKPETETPETGDAI